MSNYVKSYATCQSRWKFWFYLTSILLSSFLECGHSVCNIQTMEIPISFYRYNKCRLFMLVKNPLIKLTVRATPLPIMHQIQTKNPDTQFSKLQQRTRYACLSLQFLFIRNNTDLLLEHLIINTLSNYTSVVKL